jgi:hypothetical protein
VTRLVHQSSSSHGNRRDRMWHPAITTPKRIRDCHLLDIMTTPHQPCYM